MNIKLTLVGVVNEHQFRIDEKGKGKPYKELQHLTLTEVEGGPLPCSYDILTTIVHYGNRAFVNYPKEIPDILKETCSGPNGRYFWQRTTTFEDGGVYTATSNIRVDGDTFNYDIHFMGASFSLDGPVMQKRTMKWEPSTEIMFERDGLLRGDNNIALLLDNGGHYRCDFKTIYKPSEAVKMPGYHFVDHHIEITSQHDNYNVVELYEGAAALYSALKKEEQAKE